MKTQSRPFTVTVKRQKRAKGKSIWSDTPNMADMLAQAETGDEAAEPAPAVSDPRQNASAPKASAKDQKHKAKSEGANFPAANFPAKAQERRILADLTPVEQPVSEVELELSKRPRGRPRKVLLANGNANDSATPERADAKRTSSTATSEPFRQPAVSRRPRQAPVQPSKAEIFDARDFDEAGEIRVASEGFAQADAMFETAVGVDGAEASTEDRNMPPRRRTGTTLRRGERWKRHLPRWKR